MVFSFVGYQTKEITGIKVGENEVKELSVVNLSSSSVGLRRSSDFCISTKKYRQQGLAYDAKDIQINALRDI